MGVLKDERGADYLLEMAHKVAGGGARISVYPPCCACPLSGCRWRQRMERSEHIYAPPVQLLMSNGAQATHVQPSNLPPASQLLLLSAVCRLCRQYQTCPTVLLLLLLLAVCVQL
jgi:hypothetical protein